MVFDYSNYKGFDYVIPTNPRDMFSAKKKKKDVLVLRFLQCNKGSFVIRLSLVCDWSIPADAQNCAMCTSLSK